MTEIPVIPENSPFQPEQRVWLNGFLAGYFARLALPDSFAATPAPSKPSIPLLILFGSQTGTAQALANRIARQAAARGFNARVRDAAEHEKIEWRTERALLMVTSTYGDGDMPDNAQGFWEWLQTETAAGALSHLRFAILALGDRNYAEFCGAGKKIDARLEQLGANRFFNRVDCDVDYEAEASAWMDAALNAALESSPELESGLVTKRESVNLPLNSSTGSTNGHISAATDIGSTTFSKANPFPAPLLKNICLNKSGSGKEVRHYELNLQGSGLAYEAGDALGVVPHNCPGLVDEVLHALRCTCA